MKTYLVHFLVLLAATALAATPDMGLRPASSWAATNLLAAAADDEARINLGSPLYLDSIAALQAHTGSDTVVFVTDTNRGGLFVASTDALAHDGGVVFTNTGMARVWVRKWDGNMVDVKWFGAVPDGVTDNADAINSAASAARSLGSGLLISRVGNLDVSFLPGASYYVSSPLYLTNIDYIIAPGPIAASASVLNSGPVVTVGAVGRLPLLDIYINIAGTINVADSAATNSVGLRVISSGLGSAIKFDHITRMGTAIELAPVNASYGVQGISWECGDFYKCKNNLRVDKTINGAVNEHIFNGGYWRLDSALGGYNIDVHLGQLASSRFNACAFEGDRPLVLGNGILLEFNQIRIEKSFPATLYESIDPTATESNDISTIRKYPALIFNLNTLDPAGLLQVNVAQQAYGIVWNRGNTHGKPTMRWVFGPSVRDWNYKVYMPNAIVWDYDTLTASRFIDMSATKSWEPIEGGAYGSDADSFPMTNKMFAVKVSKLTTQNLWLRAGRQYKGMVYVQAFTSAGALVTNPDYVFGPYCNVRTSGTSGNTYFTFSTGAGDIMLGSTVAYAYVGIGDDLFNAAVNNPVNYLPEFQIVDGDGRFEYNSLHVDDIPSSGLVEPGLVFQDSDSLTTYVAGPTVETTISSDEASGQTTISVTSTAGMEVGDTVVINSTSAATPTELLLKRPSISQITSVGVGTIDISPALVSAAGAGQRVVAQRWTSPFNGVLSASLHGSKTIASDQVNVYAADSAAGGAGTTTLKFKDEMGTLNELRMTRGTKTLTDATATKVFWMPLTADSFIGGQVLYTIYGRGTNGVGTNQVATGVLKYSGVTQGSTEVVSLTGDVTESGVTLSSSPAGSVLTWTWTADFTTNEVADFKLNADTDLAGALTFRVDYTVIDNTAKKVNPQ